MSATVYLTAIEAGLTKWDTFKKPPYTMLEYSEAYNNGINLASAIEDAYASGASNIIIERGNYPLCYAMTSRHSTYINSACVISNVDNTTVDGNSSVFFALFDSENLSPYQTGDAATNLSPYQLGGALFEFRHTTNLVFKGFELRGDQYNRSWVSGESSTEQTYGIMFKEDNIGLKIDIIGHGFRGDAITSNHKGITVAPLTDNWSKGGVNLTTGAEEEQAGSYRTARIDISNSTIYRNSIQLMTTGNTAQATFRNEELNVFFYDAAGAFISKELAFQCVFTVLPAACKYVQYVAYGDERIDDVVGYGTYLNLTTGCSYDCEVRGEFYANMRGAISNLCGGTKIDAYIHDNGTNKYNFPHYSDTTRYGINFEDTYVDSLEVRGRITDGGSGILANVRRLTVSDCLISNMLFGGIGTYSTRFADISNVDINNVGRPIFTTPSHVNSYKREIIFRNNRVRNADWLEDLSKADGLLFSIESNKFNNCNMKLTGNGKNITFHNNSLITFNGGPSWSCELTGLRSIADNYIDGKLNTPRATSNFLFTCKQGDNNWVEVREGGRVLASYSLITNNTTTGMTYELFGIPSILIPRDIVSLEGVNVVEQTFNNCKFIGQPINLGDPNLAATLKSSKTVFNECYFKPSTVNEVINVYISENDITKTHTIIFRDCTFDMTVSDGVIKMMRSNVGAVNIVFIGCSFISDNFKSLKFFGSSSFGFNGLSARSIGCTYSNIKLV